MLKSLFVAAQFLVFSISVHAGAHAGVVSVEEQRAALQNAEALVHDRYVGVERVDALIADLRDQNAKAVGDRDGEDFAAYITRRLRNVSKDGHLGLKYSENPIPLPQSGDTPLTFGDDFEKWYGAGVNHGVEKIERLDGNVMLLDLRVFPPPEMGADIIAAAMNLVAQGNALIIDLRRNGGGGDTVELVMAYLVEPGSPFLSTYNRPTNHWEHRSIPYWVPGRRFGSEKPLFVLISHQTFSAAEALAYSLQAMGRATIIGETSGGGAHPFEYRRLSAHFALELPESKSQHPLTGTSWQDVGVVPDVRVSPDQALIVAHRLAREAIKDRSASAPDPRSLP